MERLELKGTKRGKGNKGISRRLRASGKLPAVCYGCGVDSVSLAVDPVELGKVINTDFGPNIVFDLSFSDEDGKAERRTVMLKALQRDPVSRRYVHADFWVVDEAHKVLVDVPVCLVGRARGVALGGRLRQAARSVKVRCLPKDIPVSVNFDVSDMGLGERALVSQITPDSGLELVFDQDFAIAQIIPPRGEGGARVTG